MAWYGNRPPKTLALIAVVAGRVSNWSLAPSGLVHAGPWIFASIPVAAIGGSLAVLAGAAATIGQCLSLRTFSDFQQATRSRSAPGPVSDREHLRRLGRDLIGSALPSPKGI